MRNGELGPNGPQDPAKAVSGSGLMQREGNPADPIIETVVSPFHCLYQDALWFHTQSHVRLARSESEASRLARAALALYLASAESLAHQAIAELGRPELIGLAADPDRPLPIFEVWKLLPAIVAEADTPATAFQPDSPPWPQFAELLDLRAFWAYPGTPDQRRAYYRADPMDGSFEPLEPFQAPPELGLTADQLHFPRTGLPRDPYALRPRHLDTARSVLDAAINALDRRLGGALTRDGRHRKEPVRRIQRTDG